MTREPFEAMIVESLQEVCQEAGWAAERQAPAPSRMAVDLVMQHENRIVPLEVKSGKGRLDFTSISQADDVQRSFSQARPEARVQAVILTTQEVSDRAAEYASQLGVDIVQWRGGPDAIGVANGLFKAIRDGSIQADSATRESVVPVVWSGRVADEAKTDASTEWWSVDKPDP